MTKYSSPLRSAAALCLATSAVGAPNQPPPGPVPPAENQKLAHDIFRDIVEVRSVHDAGTKGVADILVRYLKANGFSDSEINVVPEPAYPKQVNVIARLKGKGRGKPVMWICHIDVVDARPEDWSLPPYKFTEKDGYYYGRGASDMKDEDAAAAASLIRLKKEHFVPDRDIMVAFTADEESGDSTQNGPKYLLRQKRELVDAGLVINPDGGSGEIQNGKRLDFSIETVQKTYMTFRMETANRGGHSSEPRPDNAIYQLATGLAHLAQFQFPFKTNATTRAYFQTIAMTASGQKRSDLIAMAKQPVDEAAAARLAKDTALNAILHTTCVATMLKAGVQENALPSSATAVVQCRVFSGESVEDTRAALAKVAGDPGIKVSLMEPVDEAKETVPDPKVIGQIARVVHSMWPGVPVMPEMAAGASDSIYTRAAGMPSYGAGGGWFDINDIRAHGRDERDEIGNFNQTVEFTYRLMKELGGG